MSNIELGPCPFCGGEAVKLTAGDFGQSEVVKCSNHWCGMGCETTKTWNRLSAIAGQNRRRGETLEKLKKWAGKIGYPDWVKLCEAALK